MNKDFLELLDRMRDIHDKKARDYTTAAEVDPYENFNRSNAIASWFPDNYKSFTVLIGTKLARLGALLTSNRSPNNESIDDSFLDLVVYCGLMYSYYKKNNQQFPEMAKATDIPYRVEQSLNTCTHTHLTKDWKCVNCQTLLNRHQVETNYFYSNKLDGYRFREK